MMQSLPVTLSPGQEARFDVPGLHLHHGMIINQACNNVEDRHGAGFAFTLVPSYTSSEVLIQADERGIAFHPESLAVEILQEVLALERASACDAVHEKHVAQRADTEATIAKLQGEHPSPSRPVDLVTIEAKFIRAERVTFGAGNRICGMDIARFKPIQKVWQHVNGREFRISNAMIGINMRSISTSLEPGREYVLTGHWEQFKGSRRTWFMPEVIA